MSHTGAWSVEFEPQTGLFVPSTSTRLAIGFFLDHDDSIEGGLLANGLNNTAAAWEVRYTHDIDIERAQ